MSFIKNFTRSLVSQVGRDTGKVLSNQLYGDAHSTPIRRVGSGNALCNSYLNGVSCEMSEQDLRDQVIEEGYHFTSTRTHPAIIVIAIVFSYLFIFVIGVLFIVRGILRITTKYSIYKKTINEAVFVQDRRYKTGARVDHYTPITKRIKVIANQNEKTKNQQIGVLYLCLGIGILLMNIWEVFYMI